MSRFIYCAVIIAVFGLYIGKGSSLTCYECNSTSDRNCTFNRTAPEKYAKTCPLSKNATCLIAFTLQTTIRKCSDHIATAYDCYPQGVPCFVSNCTTDYCNWGPYKPIDPPQPPTPGRLQCYVCDSKYNTGCNSTKKALAPFKTTCPANSVYCIDVKTKTSARRYCSATNANGCFNTEISCSSKSCSKDLCNQALSGHRSSLVITIACVVLGAIAKSGFYEN